MHNTKIKPNTKAAQVLQALRANPLEPEQIALRWSDANVALNLLKRLGYIEPSGSRDGLQYRITEAGRAACPARRAA
jgi:hypothetical protein